MSTVDSIYLVLYILDISMPLLESMLLSSLLTPVEISNELNNIDSNNGILISKKYYTIYIYIYIYIYSIVFFWY